MSSALRPPRQARPGTGRSTRRSTRGSTRRSTAPALALLVGLAAGCSSEDRTPAGSGESGPSLVEPSDAPTLQIEPVTMLGRVTGRLARPAARKVEQRVSRIAVRWLTDAYVGGRFPRKRFDDAFAGFSRGARTAARSDLRVMSNAGLGARVEEVTATGMSVEVDLLAVDNRPVGSTAHVLTTFRTDGPREGRYRVSGRLMLTKDEGRWNVFAYHVSKGGRECCD